MVRRSHPFCADRLVAVEAGVTVADRLQLRLDGFEVMDAVARRAGETFAIVDPAGPVGLARTVVTGETGLDDVGRLHRLHRDDRTSLALLGLRLEMSGHVAVAVGADARGLHVVRVLESRELLFVTRPAVVDVVI